MKVLKKLTLVAVDEIKLHNQEMKQVLGGTYGDSYGGCDSYSGCDYTCRNMATSDGDTVKCSGTCDSGKYCGIVDPWGTPKCECK